MKNVKDDNIEQAERATSLFSLVICTYNRADSLRDTIQSALAQEAGARFDYEVLVVDNNSSDSTRDVVHEFSSSAGSRLHYLFEPRQGKSYALNRALGTLRGDFYAIVDDDFILPPDWLSGMYDGILRYPDASFYSGKVLPKWAAPPPRWLTPEHWSPIALADYGSEEFLASSANEVCLLACVFRTSDVHAVGGYDVRLGVKGSRIGGVEDLELLRRLWKAQCYGVYLPSVSFLHKVEAERMTRRYHRRWHREHGHSYAVMGFPDYDSAATVFGLPRFMVRSFFQNCIATVWYSLTRKPSRAFLAETRARFILGFVEKRRERGADA